MPFITPSTPPAFSSGEHCWFSAGVVANDGTVGTAVQFPGRDWSLSIKGMVKDVSNSRDGRKRIRGLQDADGDFKLPYDTANDPATAGLKDGTILAAKFYVNDTKFYAMHVIVDEVGPAVEFEGELMFSVKFSLESGTVTYPA